MTASTNVTLPTKIAEGMIDAAIVAVTGVMLITYSQMRISGCDTSIAFRTHGRHICAARISAFTRIITVLIFAATNTSTADFTNIVAYIIAHIVITSGTPGMIRCRVCHASIVFARH